MINKYRINHLDCASCAQKIEDMMNKRIDVQECSLSFASGIMIIESERTIDSNILLLDIQKVEPNATIEYKDNHEHEHLHNEECDCKHEHGKDNQHHDHHKCECEHDEVEHAHHDLDKQTALSFHIQGLDCASCAMKVEAVILKMDIIEDAALNFSTETLQVKTKENFDIEQLRQGLQSQIDEVEDGVVLLIKKSKQVADKAKLFDFKDNITLIAGVVVYLGSVLLEANQLAIFGFVAAYILIGHEVLLKAIRNIFRGQIFDENFLMSIATIGAFLIGDYAEAVAVLLFYSIGEIFQSYAVNKTRGSISDLMDIKSEFANLKTSDGVKKVAPEKVKVDDILLVKVGEKIPLDGIVLTGSSSLDTSSLTGESFPREVGEGQEVLAGVVNLTNILEIRVTQPYENSTVSKIIELMENAASKKAPIEKFITRFARIYTPTVVVLAVLLAIVPMFIFKDAVFNDWLYRALTFLVVSCPCALVISIPLGLYAGLGKASKVGALIKGGNYLELLKDLDTVVFDKTGTLTEGKFDVVEVNGSDDLLMYGAYGEYLSNHPIAKSIVAYYNDKIDESLIRDFKEIAGKGIDVYIKDQHVLLGNEGFLKDSHIDVQKPSAVGTIIYVVIDNQFKGSIVVADKIKDSTIKGIQALKKLGIKNTVMLTGDHKFVAEDIAKRIGIDTVYSELLPQDKVTQVEKLLDNKKGYVAFVGDGINDAPVLARADVGIAMGGVGSDAAIEAADVVLMKDDIMAISEAIQISRKTNSVLIQNVVFSLVVKIGVLFLTMFGYSNMWMGVFADVGVTLIAIFNSMRVLK